MRKSVGALDSLSEASTRGVQEAKKAEKEELKAGQTESPSVGACVAGGR